MSHGTKGVVAAAVAATFFPLMLQPWPPAAAGLKHLLLLLHK
jgi:hypothetical protein